MIRVTTFAGKTVAVFGLARSGIASAEALRDGGATIACWDDGEAGRAAAAKAGLPLVDLAIADWTQFEALVLAPGVPLTHPKPHWTVEKAQKVQKDGNVGIDIIGDIELFFRERAKSCPECPVVAITGTNGKSTTTALIAHILRAAGKDVQMGGNIGVGILSLEPPAPDRYYVIEMSSFQIDLTPSLHPTVGVLLNITPDHLDRHGTMEEYAAIKARLILEADTAILGTADAPTREIRNQITSGKSDPSNDARRPMLRQISEWVGDMDAVVCYGDGRLWFGEPRQPIDLTGAAALRGRHNEQNAAAAFATCYALGLDPGAILKGLKSFPGLAHRMEPLGTIGRTVIVNDSKGTNADSTEKALASFPGAIYWIAGGVPKEGGIESLAPYFDRVAKAYLIGQCAPEFAKTLDGKVVYEMAGTLDVALAHAVRDAAQSTAAEPVVLLSPACASYDQYKSFEHRGDHFRALATATPGFVGKASA